jgi:protein-disulfide isomerase
MRLRFGFTDKQWGELSEPTKSDTDMRFKQTSPNNKRQALRLLGAGILGLAGLPTAQARPGDASGELERALEKLLKERPELVRDALNTLEQREAAARLRNEQALLRASAKAIYAEAGATVLGNPSGKVTLIEFIDYRCGYCKHLQADINTLIQGDRQLRVLVKHLPILGPESLAASQLVLSAGQGPAAQQLHQRLMTSTQLDSASLRAFKLPSDKAPVEKAKVERGLSEVRQLAEHLHIDGTPALLVGEHFMRGAIGLEQLQAAIQTSRQKQGQKPAARV